MDIKFFEIGDPKIAEKILRSLPNWFGIEESTQAYIRVSGELPMIVAYEEDCPVGFLSIKNHSAYSAEIYVMGVLPEIHRKSIGRSLLQKAEAKLSEKGIEYLQVKTVSEDRECDFYRATRLFYQANGFRPLEVFPELWDSSNPCLLLVKSIRSR